MKRTWMALLGWTLLAASAPAQEPDPAAHPATETATFSMYCYWTGEATLGRVDGVLASRIGHWGGREIVQVDYDPARTDVDELARTLKRQRSFYSLVVTESAAGRPAAAEVPPEEITVLAGNPRFIAPKHSLRARHPELVALDLSEEQAIALNSWSYFGGPMPDVLTEEQKQRLADRADR